MTIRATAQLAFSALLRNRMRSFLTALGVIIGVAAVLMMQSLGEGATEYVGQAISGLGSNLLIAVPGASARHFGPATLGVPLFTTGDLEAVRHGAPAVARLAAVNSRPLRVVYGPNNRSTSVGGVQPEYFDMRSWGAIRGRLLSPLDERQSAPVCVIGATVRRELFGSIDPIGRELRVHDMVCRVVGELEPKGSSAFGMDQDDAVFMPYSTFSHRIIGTQRVAVIMASAVSTDRLDEAKQEITSILRRRRHILPGEEDDFAVQDPREITALLQRVTGILTTVLAGVAAISLLVGGIGIMNIMLVSVTERTREIGIRLAVGARAGDILRQFLVEAVVLSATGGLIGIVLGAGGSFLLARAVHVPFVMPLRAAPIAVGVSLLVGVIFGVFPARKAARLNPLTALRFE